MKRYSYWAGLALLLLSLMAGCAGPTAAPQPTATQEPEPATPTASAEPTSAGRQYLPYRNEELGFGLEYPEEWQLTEKQDVPAIVLVSPKKDESDEFQENVTILAQELVSPSLTLEEFSQMAIEQGAVYIPRFNVEESVPTTLGDNPAHRVIYTGLQEDRGLRWLQVWTLKDGQVYLLTYTAEELEFNRYRSIVQQMLRTMEID